MKISSLVHGLSLPSLHVSFLPLWERQYVQVKGFFYMFVSCDPLPWIKLPVYLRKSINSSIALQLLRLIMMSPYLLLFLE